MATSQRDQDGEAPVMTIDAERATLQPSNTSSNQPSNAASTSTAAKDRGDGKTIGKVKSPSKLPAWLINNLTSARSLRILARCWVASWANFLLMIPAPSLRVLGQAAFFGCMLTLMIPPSMPFFIFLIAFSMIVIGALLGWAFGCAAMAAADRARSQPLLAAAVQRVRSSAATSTNPEAYVTTAVFQGQYLDVRSTAVFGVFLMVGVYFCAVLQVKLPKLKIASIFMLIVLDIMVTYGPLFPYPRYTLGQIFMIPIGCSLAICLASQLLIFPETLSYAWQLRFLSMLTSTKDLLHLHSDALSDASKNDGPQSDPSARSPFEQPSSANLQQSLKAEDHAAQTAAGLLAKVKLNRMALAEQVADINGMTAFLGMEFYRSYFNAHDMKLIFRKTRSVNLQLVLLNAFWRLVHRELNIADPKTFDEDWDPSKVQEGYDLDGEHGTEALPTKGRLKPVKLHETHTIHRVRRDIFQSEAQQQVTMSRMLNILHRVAKPSLDAATESIVSIQSYFEANVAWRQKRSIDEILLQLHETKSSLEGARKSLLNDKRFELLQPYAEHFRALHPHLDLEQHFLQTKESIRSFRAGVRPLHVCLVFVTNLIDVLDSVSQLHAEMLTIADRAGNKKRVWWPKHLGRLAGILSSDKRGSSDGLDRFGPGDSGFDREQDMDNDFRQDRAHTASSASSAQTSAVADHLEGESDSDADNDDADRLCPSSSSPRPRDEEKAAATSKDSAADKCKKAKRAGKQRYYARDPDALAPTSVMHRIGRGIAATYYFVSGPTGMYALRMCIATLAIWITAVLPNTAYFVYQNRGIWALIMAQTAAALSGGELIFTFAMRLGGTVVGLLYGAVLWYISTGNGRGNAYGLGVATAIGFLPLVFLRIWAPKLLLLPAIMLNVSVVLIVGYSWIDTHLQVLANSGIGIEVAWRRTLLVIIGMAVALIVMILPRPVSSRMLLRKNMAKVTRQLNEMFVEVMEAWIARNRIYEQEWERAGFANQIDGNGEKTSKADAIAKLWQEREAVIRARFMAVNARVATYPMQIGMASMDFHIRGRWPSERYVEIASVHATIVESLGAILSSVRAFDGYATSSADDVTSKKAAVPTKRERMDWQLMMSSSTSLLDPQYLSEICTIFDLLSKALRNGERLNHASFSLLENHFKYGERNRRLDAILRKNAAAKKGLAEGNKEEGPALEGEDVLDWSVLQDAMYLRYTTARMAAITLATELDKFKAIVQDLVGESSLHGFDMLKERHDERLYQATVALNKA
ncbi:hypothetical protein NDA11_007442 [Ustilago hordei]|nr:hypothetical protein NDA10_005118 [Ustilago hordei]KAJ1584410.1 hypothetical protein NDA12_006940 [Ustilago hordei]KAJ1593549.1 hypothetical protein NDA15_006106 [Ustilago hordei]KAJ1595679.1 hypothetical protein NDA11_007442 [Ustilago hordei]KAJ1603756.1 hypothetical protein NDA14_007301 [Ustilago hordei]